MSERTINVEMMKARPNVGNDPHVKLLASLLEIARIDHTDGNLKNRERMGFLKRIPSQLGAWEIDDFLDESPEAVRHQASELLLTEAIESTSIVAEEVQRTVVAGAEKFKVIRDIGAAWYTPKSNSLRVPLGETERNAEVVPESAEIMDRTQDYDKRDFVIVKYGVKPRISFEMVEDGMVDAVAEELFYAGASLENKLNYDALTALATNAGNTTATTGGAGAGVALTVLKEARKLVRKDGFYPDVVIMSTDFEADLLVNTALATPYAGMTENIMRQGVLPSPLLGMKWYVTDNGSTLVDGTNPWAYDSNLDVGAVVLEARRGCGIAMRRDRTVNRFDDIVRELKTITATMRVDVNYLHANAIGKCNWRT